VGDLAQDRAIMPVVRFKNTGVNVKQTQKFLEKRGGFLRSVFVRSNAMRGGYGLFGEYAGVCSGG
jgi:hypothetical protein